ncbi:class I adenylate-forming enzyme family protein [Cryptosporangium aurantiacum]|uniref:Acyl-CoA synthetase (AMP-forming)/AMP-acid ligase II n=1 Tax=Cryptosporangium aurantiacum TaxID=134849 RepID=A0A1M7RJX2_9ACTN|nr:class I adenylate-forming enzyme family protein [Cryptosporangium aurantiacum]SHN46607.1 Acyl-CoA synthetase (AMP-forming)/AMP-acid ligase II [Cryptosporangium aurantiacum]
MLTNDLDRLPSEMRTALCGPGSPFELTRESVRGVELTVFARRPPHLPGLLLAAAEQHGDRPYLVFPDRRLTYKETVGEIPAVAAVLRDRHGIGHGDRVAVVGPNSLEYAVTLWAVAWLGAISVSLNGWWTGPEMRHGLQLAEPKLLIGEDRQLERLGDTELPAVPTVTFAALFAAHDADKPGAPIAPDLAEDDAVSILFTSGTTGRPKGAVITHRGLVNFAQDSQLRGYTEAILSGQTDPPPGPPVALVVSPFFHISGLAPLLAGGPFNGMAMVFPPRGRWDPDVHLELTTRYGVTQWSGVPTQLLRLLRMVAADPQRYDVSQLRTIGMGGAPISTELAVLLGSVIPGARPAQGFGMSETCGQGTTIAGARMVDNPQSIGLATPTSEVMLGDVGDDGIGEIRVRTPSVFLGYWNDPDATAAVLDADGWYRTGDYGRVVDGMLQLESRLRDMIIRGGENIYPIEIENRLSEHPDVLDAAVIGVPHDELGQEVMAVVVAPNLTVADIQAWAGETLAPYKVPAHVRFVDALPYSATGKLLKRELEKQIAD